MKKIRLVSRVSAVLVVMLLTAGCSRVDLIHAFADDVLEDRAERFLMISDSPSEHSHVSRTIDAMFDEQTPVLSVKIEAFLNRQADLLMLTGGDVAIADAESLIADFRTMLAESAEIAAPYGARVLVRHTTPERIAHLEEEMAAWREERREERFEEDPEDIREEKIESTVESVERFVPDLTDAQIAMITDFVDGELARDVPGRWHEYTERRHAALIAFMRMAPSESELEAFLVPWMARPYTLVDPGFEAHADRWWAGKARLIHLVVNSLSDEQRAGVVERLRGYAGQVAELS